MSQLVGKLKASGADARTYDILVYQTIVAAGTRGNPHGIAQSEKRFVTECGLELLSIDSDTLEVIETGERLTILW